MDGNQRVAHFGKLGWGLIVHAGLTYMVVGAFWTSSASNVIVPTLSAKFGFPDTSRVLYTNTIVAIICVATIFLVTYIYSKFKTRIMNFIMLSLAGVALFFVGHVNSLFQYAVVWICIYTAAQIMAQTGLGMLFGHYMPTKKGTALGWATVGSSLSNVIALPILNRLINVRDFAFAATCFGVYMLVLAFLHLFLWPDDSLKRGYEPDNGDISPEELALVEESQKHPLSNWTIKELVTNKNFWLLGFGYGCMMLVTVGIGSQFVVYEVSNGISQAAAIATMSGISFVGVAGSIASGYIDQKLGVKVAAMLLAGCYAISCFFAGYLPFSMVTNVLFIAFYCILMGAISNLPSSHGIGCFGIDFAKAWKFILPIIMLMTALASLLLGAFQSMTGSYKGAYAVLMWVAIAGLILFACSDSKLIKNPGEKPIAVKRGTMEEQTEPEEKVEHSDK